MISPVSVQGQTPSRAAAFMLIAVGAGAFVFILFRNTGLNPVVFGDEWLYSFFSRLAAPSESPRPSFLYLWLFRSTNVCGAGFLECARILNSLLIVLTLPLIYLVGRRVASRSMAIFIAAVSVLGPINTYTAYFMPEAMYFLGFWFFVWVSLTARGRPLAQYAVAVGTVLALLALVKAHAMFLLASIGLFELTARWNRGRSGALRDAALIVLLSSLTFLVVRLAIGFLVAGENGLSLFGSTYTAIGRSGADDMATYAVSLLRSTMVSLAGHGLGLVLLFGVPLAIIIRYVYATRGMGDLDDRKHEIAVFAIALVVSLLMISALFTAKVAGTGPYDSVWRIHARYYNFIFPLFLIAAASQISGPQAETPALTRWLGAAIGITLIGLSASVIGAYFTPNFVDSPELRGVTARPVFAWTVASLGILSLAAWTWSARAGSRVYLFVFVPVAFGVGALVASAELRQRMVPDFVDESGRFARLLLGSKAEAVVVAGSDHSSLFRAQFHMDHPGTTQMLLKSGETLRFCDIPADRDWVLLLGEHETDFDRSRQIAMQGYALIRLGEQIDAKFSDTAWPGQFTVVGLSGAEPWGRWSQSERVVLQFYFPLPERPRIAITAGAFGPNVGEPFLIRVGQEEKAFQVGATPEEVVLEFETDGNVRSVEILVPKPTSPSELGVSADPRRLGIALVRLRVDGAGLARRPSCGSARAPQT